MNEWFSIDKAGLSAILERRGKAFALFELISNAWDSGATRVDVKLLPIAGKPLASLEVADNGEGFTDLDHAFTMFARSSRADRADKRGRFNLGEKLVLAICKDATIATRCGSITFNESGRRRSSETFDGTRFRACVRMTHEEVDDCVLAMTSIVPPVPTTINGQDAVITPNLISTFTAKLPTEIADADGNLRRTMRQCGVNLYEGSGEILEMGVPVCEAPFPFRADVQQKIPLTMERDAATAAFVKALQVAVLNHTHQQLDAEQAAAPWAQDAMGDARVSGEAVKGLVVKRFGERAVVATPADPLANAQAAAAGCSVIHGGAMSADAWANVRKYAQVPAASAAFPSPRPEDVMNTMASLAASPICPTCGRPKS